MPLTEPEVLRALEIARALAHAGVPLFLATPNPAVKAGFDLPSGWERTPINPSVVDRWRPGMALCAVGGHTLDVLDVDPRNGGLASSEALWQAGHWPVTYGLAFTPSGGSHNLIQPLGQGKGELVAGVDLQGGRSDGTGRGFVFIAPTVRASKVDGVARPYRWDVEPDLARLAQWRGEESGKHLASVAAAWPVNQRASHEHSGVPVKAPGDLLLADQHTTISADRTIASMATSVTDAARQGWGAQFRSALNRAAYAIGAYVGSGYITEPQVIDVLAAAIRLAGHEPDGNDYRWIEQGVADGAQAPIVVVRPFVRVEGEHERVIDTGQRLVDGDTFLSEVPDDEPALWGSGEVCLWAPGESLMLVGPPGVGKSTLAHLVVFGTLGLLPEVLGYPAPDTGRGVLYLAMDRPKQIARAMRRLRTEESRCTLKERLTVHKGPLPVDLADDDAWILRQAQAVGATVVVIDSVKDLLPDLSDEKSASLYNRARQLCLAEGVEWIELHHNRKATAGNEEPKSLDDVYGSRWLTAGAGSVLSLYGQPGDAVVRLSQIKAPSGELFPRFVAIDKDAGTMELYGAFDLTATLTNSGKNGLVAREAAAVIYETKKPSKSQIETSRQRLERLVRDGTAFSGADTDPEGRGTKRYWAAATAAPTAPLTTQMDLGDPFTRGISGTPSHDHLTPSVDHA